MSMEPFFEQLQSGIAPSLDESMRYEGLRLASFHKRPNCFTTSAVILANAGFYYTGNDDVTACFKCGLEVENWSSLGPHVDPRSIHYQRSPNCRFLSNISKENVPFAVDTSTLYGKAKEIGQQLAERSALYGAQTNSSSAISFQTAACEKRGNESHHRTSGMEFDGEPKHRNDIGLSHAGFSESSAGLRTYTSSLSDTAAPSRPFLLDAQPPPPMFDREIQSTPNFKDEEIRLDTYTYWPNGSAIRPAELAKAGFYYLGTEDRVQCAFCKGVLRNWDPADRAFDEHKKHFPACPFMRDPTGVGNIPIMDQFSKIKIKKDTTMDYQLEEHLLGIQTERAYHPHMALNVERLNSFKNFYSDSSKAPEDFADAGFFFTGQGDNVKCFFCDGGLRNWERNDDPWLEHARWFPKCGYLLSKKGEDFVKDTRKRFAPPGTQKPRIKKLKEKHSVNEQEVDKFMGSDIVQDATCLGFPLSSIREIVCRRLRELGSGFPNMESLCEALYEAEELEAQESGSESDSGFEEFSNFQSDKQLDSSETSETNMKKNTPEFRGYPEDLMDVEEKSKAELENEVRKMQEERLCKVCMDNEGNIVFLPCGHLACCSDCAPAFRHCPMCRNGIRGTIRVFMP